MKIPAPDNIQSIHPYIPGKPIEEVKRELGITDILKLASNENPLGSSPKAMEAYGNFVEQLSVYPEGGGFYLREALGRRFVNINIQAIISFTDASRNGDLVTQCHYNITMFDRCT